MTYKEKYRLDHSDMSEEEIVSNLEDECPDTFYNINEPKYCDPYTDACEKCWEREYQENAEKLQDQPTIKDSGDRTEFESGAVRDMHEGKGRMDLLPWTAIMEVSKHCENGAKKYGEHNVDKGIPTNSLCDSAARHLAKYLEGWTDEPHLVAAAWNLLWAIQMEIKKPEVVNTPWNLRDGITTMKLE